MTDSAPSADTRPPPAGRSTWRAVSIPTEHGGWGLTLEPVVLGLIVAWSVPGMAMGLAALLAFLARTPLKVVMVDRYRHRSLGRTRLAARVASVEIVLLVGLFAFVAFTAPGRTWIPLVIASPLIAVELWFDMRSRSRRLVPELAGAIGMGSIAAAIALAGDEAAAVAAGLWCVLAARAVGSIPFVRGQIKRTRDSGGSTRPSDTAQIAALGIVVGGWAFGWVPALGVASIVLLAAFQLVGARATPRPIVVVGVQQTVLGLVVVAMTAVGVLVT